MIAIQSNSQTIYSATSSDNVVSGRSITSVANIGNDIKLYNSEEMMVMVCDGEDEPMFAWKDIATPTNGDMNIVDDDDPNVSNTNITDPDVVLMRDDGACAIVVFEEENDIYYNILKYNGTDWDYEDDGAVSLGSGSNPNIDSDYADYIVITWEDCGDIKALSGTYSGSFSFSWNSTVTVNSSGDARYPDVTVYENDNTRTVSFTYLIGTITISGTHYLKVQQESYSDVASNSIQNNITLSRTVGESLMMGRPRIASPLWLNNSDYSYDDDYTVVVGLVNNDGQTPLYDIWGYNLSMGSSSVEIDYTDDVNLPDAINKEPSITYSGDLAVVAWTTDYQGDNDVFARQLYCDGSLATGYYSAANYNTTNQQQVVAVSGRNDGLDILYTWHDDDESELRYKTASSSSQYLRLKGEHTGFAIWYNPDTQGVCIESEKEALCQVIDMAGSVVLNGIIREGSSIIDISNLQKSVYIVILSNDVLRDQKKIIAY